MERINLEIDPDRSSRPSPSMGKAEMHGLFMARAVCCFRGSYPRHVLEGLVGNKGEPVSSGGACKVGRAYKARTI